MPSRLGGVHSTPRMFHLHHPLLPRDFQVVLENTVYKVEDLGGTSWKMTILNIRSLASLTTNINGTCSEPQKLGTAFGKHFSQVSSNENYDPEFLTYKVRK